MPRPRSRIRYDLALERRPMRLVPRVIPTVDPWMAGEMFLSNHVEERRRGLAILIGSESARRSPLTAQLLATRLDEPDLNLRAQIVSALADYFELRGREYRYPLDLRARLVEAFRKYERPQICAVLELQRAAPKVKLRPETLLRLFERIPNASVLLTRLACDRTAQTSERLAAIEIIGQVGFLDALEALMGLETRLAGRRAGQMGMAFAPSDNTDELSLLPALKRTLKLLADG